MNKIPTTTYREKEAGHEAESKQDNTDNFYQMWGWTPLIPALEKLRQNERKFDAGLCYIKDLSRGLEQWFSS